MFTLHQLPPAYLRARSVSRSVFLSVYGAPRSNSNFRISMFRQNRERHESLSIAKIESSLAV